MSESLIDIVAVADRPGMTDVIVVGAGPTGLMLAAELRLAAARLQAPAAESTGELSDPLLPDVSLAFALFRPAAGVQAGGHRR